MSRQRRVESRSWRVEESRGERRERLNRETEREREEGRGRGREGQNARVGEIERGKEIERGRKTKRERETDRQTYGQTFGPATCHGSLACLES